MAIVNRSAYHHYQIDKTYIAGIVLQGTEVKSLRAGKANLKEAYCYVAEGELFIKNLHISEYSLGTYANHQPTRTRKLLLTKKEIRKITARVKEKGLTIVVLKLFFNPKGLVKLEIATARGKKLYDKRESIKRREAERRGQSPLY